MKRYKGYFIDLDGTLFRGDEVIPGAPEFVAWLNKIQIPYLYLTNNSTRSPEWVAAKLQRMGYPARTDQVFTTALATACYLQEKEAPMSVYVVGEEGLFQAISDAGIAITDQNPDAVVVGLDRSFTYEKMKKACLAIRAGAKLIGTNADLALPTEEGLWPGSGSLSVAIAAAAGTEPFFIGKPEPVMMHYALKKIGLTPDEVLVVGDNLQTDILAGIRGGMDTLLVYTGVTTPQMAKSSDIKSTHAVYNLSSWIK
ncbi:TIGR01457 family HAD-type hydrolase [Thermoactinomyces mirandus]|uniref:TIGR01457 family HAD-type hydrolase n=1 Tax=Thermoactinomyces mirandus TaxID=2756294 RepID=A0A7W1XT20_9BACL|nr:TIGR01457 family HAD-type hydrolase [Thermoactinomyces mirandus]MBA4602763.1 TIGR01457 family HAD-type hydrolase [Thermoactinomyces mirandus]